MHACVQELHLAAMEKLEDDLNRNEKNASRALKERLQAARAAREETCVMAMQTLFPLHSKLRLLGGSRQRKRVDDEIRHIFLAPSFPTTVHNCYSNLAAEAGPKSICLGKYPRASEYSDKIACVIAGSVNLNTRKSARHVPPSPFTPFAVRLRVLLVH